jgi:hypothetical protein
MGPPAHPVLGGGPTYPRFRPTTFDDALKAYNKLTNNDLLSHLLTAQLETCDSPSAILPVLREQIQVLNQSSASDERMTTWLDPTVNVLYALPSTLGQSVNLVWFRIWDRLRPTHSS